MIGLGIDTGGTCTDAVIYDLTQNNVLACAKSLTTKEDLKLGIRNALEQLPKEALKSCRTLALSTTLATNACVENRGGNGKLVLIGLDRDTLTSCWQQYGYDSLEDIYLLECRLSPSESSCDAPDWNQFRQDMETFAVGCDCISIVQLFAKEHHGAYEKHAAEILHTICDIPVILGHALFPDRNILRRGAGALLNARLVPVIHEFLSAIRQVLLDFSLDLPLLIMRSDGNLMSGDYTCLHPVETLLCGPAASIMGAMHMARTSNAVIVDMGGTTTDVSVVKNSMPLLVEGGIQIADWKTFVKGLYVDTFALGGDTAVHIGPPVSLDTYRILPLCSLASRYPDVLAQLKELERYGHGHPLPVHEFFLLLKDLPDPSRYTEMEVAICRALQNGPLRSENLARAVSRDLYALKTDRLEKEGILLRSGLTPTDAMHFCGDYQAYSREASELAFRFASRCTGISPEDLCVQIYDLVRKRLYCNLVRILLDTEYNLFAEEPCSRQTDRMIELCYDLARDGEPAPFQPAFFSSMPLIGIGAPTHVFLEPVARMLGTRAVIPKYASVANAIGAIVGNISASATAEIRPDPVSAEMFQVTTATDTCCFSEFDDAVSYARKSASSLAKDAALLKGAKQPFSVSFSTARKEAVSGSGTIFLSERITATATGSNKEDFPSESPDIPEL